MAKVDSGYLDDEGRKRVSGGGSTPAGLRRLKKELAQAEEDPVARKHQLGHAWDLIERLDPSDPEYQKARLFIVKQDGHPSAKESLR